MKTWLIEAHCDGHTCVRGVMTCEEDYVKDYCKCLTNQSELDAYGDDDDDDDPFPYVETFSYRAIENIKTPGTKFCYGWFITVNGTDYIFCNNKWWNVNIVLEYEKVSSNTCADEVLNDMVLDTEYNNNIHFTKYEDTYLVDFI